MNENLFRELTFYTLAHGDSAFIHQHVVDAYAAQNAEATTKPIAITFALIGLYLYLEHGFTGRQVQLAHIRMARHRKLWLTFPLLEDRGDIQISDVLAVKPGAARDAAIRTWCESVWQTWSHAGPAIAALTHAELGVRIPK
jgi:succinate dehydrogenase hydrophobic anchor subunit